MRQMKDSVNWAAIPVGTPIVAGYVSPSRFAWPAAGWARFPGSVQVRITPSASVAGKGIQVLDVETGDATPAQVPAWVNASRAAGQEPTAYMNVATWPAVIAACLNAGVPMPYFWVASWNGIQNLPTIVVKGVTYTAIAHQYADPNSGSGGDWDSSVAADQWPGVDQGADMPLTPADIAAIWAYQFGGYDPLNNQAPMPPIAAQDWMATTNRWANAAYVAATADGAAITAEQTALLAAIQGVQAGTVNTAQLAQALVPLLAPADAHALLVEVKALLPANSGTRTGRGQ